MVVVGEGQQKYSSGRPLTHCCRGRENCDAGYNTTVSLPRENQKEIIGSDIEYFCL